MAMLVDVACRALLIGVFLAAAVGKSRTRTARLRTRAAVTHLLHLAPGPRVVVAGALPIAEACTAAALLPPATAAVGYLLAAGLLVAFTVVVIAALRRGAPTPCHCFGADEAPLGRRHLARNLALLAAAAAGFAAHGAVPTGAVVNGGPTGIGVLAGTAGVLAAVVVVRLDSLTRSRLARSSLTRNGRGTTP